MQTCINTWCGKAFKYSAEEEKLLEKLSPVIANKRFSLPLPSKCSACRHQERLAFRNERNLYRRKCDLTNKDIISVYDGEVPFPVYEQEAWWSDQWDPLSYGREIDFAKPFFEQVHALMRTVPRRNLVYFQNENSEYTNVCSNNRNCYLLFSSDYCENCAYVSSLQKCSYCVDCSMGSDNEWCYGCLNIHGCHHCSHCIDIQGCSDCVACFDCVGCKECILCSNLRNKSYCIENMQYTREEYTQRKQALDLQEILVKSPAQRAKSFHRYVHARLTELSTGDYLSGSRNVTNGFNVQESHDCGDIWDAVGCSDCLSCNEAGECELCYEIVEIFPKGYQDLFCTLGARTSFLMYCDHCYNSEYLFGCVGLKKHRYCILNKQYTKEEYESLVPRLIDHMGKTGEWGSFFPVTLSPFAYNETIAQEYFTLTPEDVTQRGWRWKNTPKEKLQVDKVIPGEKLPNAIEDIPDDILNWAIECEATRWPFRIIKRELEFYRRMYLPVPHLHPDERHRRRIALRNPRMLWERSCAECGQSMKTTYAPNRTEKVYCEECYLKSVY